MESNDPRITIVAGDKLQIIQMQRNELERLSLLILTRERFLLLEGRLLRSWCRWRNDCRRFTLLRGGLNNNLVKRRLQNLDGVGERLARTKLTLGVPALHTVRSNKLRKNHSIANRSNSHFDLDSKDTLPEHDVPDGVVDEVLSGLTGVDHEAVGELHGLGTSSTEFARDDNLATFGAGFHNETEDTVASPSSFRCQ